MDETRNITVSEKVWAELSELKRPKQSFDELLSKMAEYEKKIRLVNDMKRIEKRSDFVEMSF